MAKAVKMEQLTTYLAKNGIVYDLKNEGTIVIGGSTFQLIHPTDGKLFDGHFHLIVNEELGCDNYIFCFGGVWYYTPKGTRKNPQLNRARYLGVKEEIIRSQSFLGVRGEYELMSGSGYYFEWVQKAKFLDIQVLGICEKNSLAGVLKFQNECKKKKIRPVIGATYSVYNQRLDLKYDIKCYAINDNGWTNLLLMNKEVNVVNQKVINEVDFLKLTSDLYIVLDPKSIPFVNIPSALLSHSFLFYQLDTVIYKQDERDKEYLLNLKQFTNSGLEPISIADAYYLDKDDAYTKKLLSKISGVYEYESDNQYFKTKEEYLDELFSLFAEEERAVSFFKKAFQNEQQLVNACQFQITRTKNHLPRYTMTIDEANQFQNNEDLFWHLIMVGLAEKVPANKHAAYLERIEIEVELITFGHFIDYFLILWDIINWSNKNGILTGIGRGSACGSLVSYLLNITRLDPLDFDLLFERFLTKGRVEGGSLPDIDCDFAGSRRDEVKKYMEQRYGLNQVFSVGTYLSFRLKSAIKEVARIYNMDLHAVEGVTKLLTSSLVHGAGFETFRLFLRACETKTILDFVKANGALVNDVLRILNLPKGNSVHACATVILPDDKDMFHWVPVRNVPAKNGEMCLVSEWEGEDLESIGLLKEDILGILQLDKLNLILELIKANRGIDIDIYNLTYDDEKVFKYFRKGWVQDVFHFGARALANYCKQMRPSEMNDLIAAIAIYRPGPIESNLHNEYILRKDGDKEIQYHWGTENITKDTYGIVVYQEQVMQICVQIGGFTLMEADSIRKALGKMRIDFSAPYRNQFLQGAIDKGCDAKEAEEIWSLMSKFASYSFNKSHAAAYAATGYISQFLKVYYPIEFWTSAFEFVEESNKEEIISQYISEIKASGDISILPVDINFSGTTIHSSYQKNTIYWSITSVKQIGDVSSKQIIKDREEKGAYFSFDEFLERHTFKGSKVNKSTVENLIYSGAFDEIENIKHPPQRKRLIEYYRKKSNIKGADNFWPDDSYKVWWWDLMQRRLSNLAFFDYEEICDAYFTCDYRYLHQYDFQSNTLAPAHYGVGGYVLEVIVRQTKKKESYCSIRIESNSTFLWLTIFPSQFNELSKTINFDKIVGSLLLVTGTMKYDDFKKENSLRLDTSSQVIILNY